MKTTLESSAPAVTALKQSTPSISTGTIASNGPDRQRVEPIKIKTILVPLDFSRASMEALDYVVALAKKFAAAIHLVHVTAPDDAASPGAAHLMCQTAESLAFAREKLAETHEKHVAPFWPANSHVRTGQPYQEICDLAREIDADLIVLATRGHTGLKRILLGSTAERVVRFAPCPVLVVRRHKGAQLRINKILVPTDFSQCAMAGLIHGALWAKAFNAKLRLLYVLFPAAAVLIDRIATNLPRDAMTVPADTQMEMEALVQLGFLEGVKTEPKIRFGYATDAICGEADDVDLVVISTHGRTGMKHALIGSVAEQVVRYAKCPVLVVPSHCGGS
jgi:nucleotide-binding universal stress UspA family protein